MDPKSLSASGRKHLPMIELDENEKILYEIRKHPVGLLGVYFVGLFVAGGLFIGALLLAFLIKSDTADLGVNLEMLRPLILLFGGLLSIASLVATAIAAYLYQSNVVYVTSEKIAQVLYRNIFHRKISQLSIGDVQDVTTTQKGILAQLFNFGTLTVETSGEQANYVFTFTPKPYEASRAIVNSHEENLKLYGN